MHAPRPVTPFTVTVSAEGVSRSGADVRRSCAAARRRAAFRRRFSAGAGFYPDSSGRPPVGYTPWPTPHRQARARSGAAPRRISHRVARGARMHVAASPLSGRTARVSCGRSEEETLSCRADPRGQSRAVVRVESCSSDSCSAGDGAIVGDNAATFVARSCRTCGARHVTNVTLLPPWRAACAMTHPCSMLRLSIADSGLQQVASASSG